MSHIYLLLLLAATSTAHIWRSGRCPDPDGQPNFDINKFLGKWYVIQKHDTSATCQAYNYVIKDGEFKVEQSTEFAILSAFNVKNNIQDIGTLELEDASEPAKFEVDFSSNPLDPAHYTVLSTDYTKYAVVFSCQNFLVRHRMSVSILCKATKMNKERLGKIRRLLTDEGIDLSELNFVDQSDCYDPEEADIRLNLDDIPDTDEIVDFLRDAAEKIKDGVDDATQYVEENIDEFRRRVAETIEPEEETTEP